MKIKPLNDRILVVRITEEEKTSGGDHHSGYGKGETPGGQDSGRWTR